MGPLRRFLTALAVATGLACCLPTAPAAAATVAPSRLTISPVILPLDARPGQVLVEPITVTASGGPLVLDFQHADFGFARDSYQVQIIEDAAQRTVPFSTRGWFSAPRGPFRLKAGERRDIPVTIRVPKSTPPGEYLGVAFFRTVPEDSGSGTRILTSARSGPLVFITIGGRGKGSLQLDSIDAPRVSRRGPIHVVVRVANHGRGHLTFSGRIRLTGPGGTHTRTLPERYSVPGVQRAIGVRLGSGHLRPGKYVTDVRLVAEPGGTVLHRQVTTWIVPVWAWIAAALLLVIGIAIVVLVVRALRQRALVRQLLARGDLDDDADDDADMDEELDWIDDPDEHDAPDS